MGNLRLRGEETCVKARTLVVRTKWNGHGTVGIDGGEVDSWRPVRSSESSWAVRDEQIQDCSRARIGYGPAARRARADGPAG